MVIGFIETKYREIIAICPHKKRPKSLNWSFLNLKYNICSTTSPKLLFLRIIIRIVDFDFLITKIYVFLMQFFHRYDFEFYYLFVLILNSGYFLLFLLFYLCYIKFVELIFVEYMFKLGIFTCKVVIFNLISVLSVLLRKHANSKKK